MLERGMGTVNWAQTPRLCPLTSHRLARLLVHLPGLAQSGSVSHSFPESVPLSHTVVGSVIAPFGPSNTSFDGGVKFPSEKPDPSRVSMMSPLPDGIALGGMTV
jgi:hypothetical protein